MRSKSAGTAELIVDGGGGTRVNSDSKIATGVAPANGSVPVVIS